MCPAATGKIRCPLRPDSMTLGRGRPEILTPPQNPPACCTQQTITVRPDVAPRPAQKHDYPSAAHRRSYARRTGAERTFSTIKDPATTSIARGWCRLTGLTPLTLWIACLLAVRNQRILHAFNARQADNARRAAAGLPPKTRKRRRQTLASLTAAAITPAGPPPARYRPAHLHRSASSPQHAPSTPAASTTTSNPAPAATMTGSAGRRQNVRPKCEHRGW